MTRNPLIACATSALLLLARPTAAQMADTDIFVADLRISGSVIEIGMPTNITNRPGYDNQPWFLRDGSGLLYNADMGGQTDVFRYDLTTGERMRLTNTPQNEFSPSLTTAGEMVVVRWEADMSDGHLWRYSAEGVPLGLHPADVPRVGYYGIVDEYFVAVFVNDSARSFVLANPSGDRLLRSTGLGGSPPQRIPHAYAVSYVQRDSAGDLSIMRLDAANPTRAATRIAPVVDGSLSYAWTNDGVLLMPAGSAIYAFDPATDTDWREVARFDGIGTIARIAISAANDRVALVVEGEGEEEG